MTRDPLREPLTVHAPPEPVTTSTDASRYAPASTTIAVESRAPWQREAKR